ncbi:Pentatricopeptide repeat-containing protein [Forsythia ovata]|uniref:Pentatricopeptide repeat-containing protein n=1 Tax=Forsythia ovata TaxID=205694 RepID=A0ABD1X612_9LAMI
MKNASFFWIQYRRYCMSTALSITSQIAHYARLGQFDGARKLFDQLPHKTVSSWNSIISCYFQNHQPQVAQHLFDQMPERNTVSWNGLIIWLHKKWNGKGS